MPNRSPDELRADASLARKRAAEVDSAGDRELMLKAAEMWERRADEIEELEAVAKLDNLPKRDGDATKR